MNKSQKCVPFKNTNYLDDNELPRINFYKNNCVIVFFLPGKYRPLPYPFMFGSCMKDILP